MTPRFTESGRFKHWWLQSQNIASKEHKLNSNCSVVTMTKEYMQVHRRVIKFLKVRDLLCACEKHITRRVHLQTRQLIKCALKQWEFACSSGLSAKRGWNSSVRRVTKSRHVIRDNFAPGSSQRALHRKWTVCHAVLTQWCIGWQEVTTDKWNEHHSNSRTRPTL